jgi:hypothetical protein
VAYSRYSTGRMSINNHPKRDIKLRCHCAAQLKISGVILREQNCLSCVASAMRLALAFLKRIDRIRYYVIRNCSTTAELSESLENRSLILTKSGVRTSWSNQLQTAGGCNLSYIYNCVIIMFRAVRKRILAILSSRDSREILA